MNILYIGSHSILEYDEVRLLSSLGHDVFSIGAYTDPANPSDDKRPPISGMTYHPDLAALCHRQREKHAGEDLRFYIDYAKADIHPDLLDWANVTIIAAFPEAWIVPQWAKLRSHRIIWRTIGQSDPSTEQYVRTISGLEIVRYSPKEKIAFESIGCFAGEDAMIRFAKDPEDWHGWDGDAPVIGNVTQDMAGRGEFCGLSFWLEATAGFPVKPAGVKSESLPGGLGQLSYEAMREYLRHIRVYLYTGTQPASYTLGFIEAMMTGVPMISMGSERFGWPIIFEADEIVSWGDVASVRTMLKMNLATPYDAEMYAWRRQRAIARFSTDIIGPQWNAYLGSKVAVAA